MQIYFELGVVFSRFGSFIDDIIRHWWKVDFEKKVFKQTLWESKQNIGIQAIKSPFLQEKVIFTLNPSSNIESRYIFQNW